MLFFVVGSNVQTFLDLISFPILWPHFQLSARRGQQAMQLVSSCSCRPDANRPRSQSKPQTGRLCFLNEL